MDSALLESSWLQILFSRCPVCCLGHLCKIDLLLVLYVCPHSSFGLVCYSNSMLKESPYNRRIIMTTIIGTTSVISQAESSPSLGEVEKVMAGQLCRCTGYRSQTQVTEKRRQLRMNLYFSGNATMKQANPGLCEGAGQLWRKRWLWSRY